MVRTDVRTACSFEGAEPAELCSGASGLRFRARIVHLQHSDAHRAALCEAVVCVIGFAGADIPLSRTWAVMETVFLHRGFGDCGPPFGLVYKC